jgi:tRNA G18 (ribose-2'-O)-methylase SpoU
MVADRYLHVEHHEDAASLAAWARAEGLPLVGVDNLPGAVPLESYPVPRACVLLFGQEGSGLSDEAREACDVTVSIAQFGSTRSINVGAAAAIAMHVWVRAHAAPGRLSP